MPDGFEIEWNGEEILAALRGADMEGLEKAAEHLLEVSSNRAPHEEGDLERSGEVSKDETQQTVAVSFDRSYAVKQHEDLTARHDPGKTAKYLEDPMHEEADTMLGLLAKPGQDLLGG